MIQDSANIPGDEAIWNHLESGPKVQVNTIRKEDNIIFCCFYFAQMPLKDMMLLPGKCLKAISSSGGCSFYF